MSGTPDGPLTPQQVEIFRRMTLQEKHALFVRHNQWVRDFKRRAIALQHPDWSPEQVNAALAALYLRSRT